MSDFQEVFEANKELSEDEVVMAIYDSAAGSLSLKEAQSEYRAMATEAGLIKTPNQKKVDWEDAVEAADLDLSTEADVATAKAIGTDLDIGATTVMKYMKALAAETGVALAVTSASRAPGKWTEVVAAFTEDEALNMPRDEVAARINEVGEYDDIKKANSYYNRLRKAFGWEAPASMSGQLNALWEDNMYATKAEIVAKGIEIGMSEASVNYYVNIYKITFDILEHKGVVNSEEAA